MAATGLALHRGGGVLMAGEILLRIAKVDAGEQVISLWLEEDAIIDMSRDSYKQLFFPERVCPDEYINITASLAHLGREGKHALRCLFE